MMDNFDKLTNLLESMEKIQPSSDLHSKVMKRVHDIPKLATLGTTLGGVFIQHKDSTTSELAQPGDALFSGDQLITKDGGKTFVIFKDGTQLWLNQNTTLDFSSSTRNVFVSVGEILAFVTKRTKGMKEFVVGTPAGLIEVLGTEFDTVVSKEKITILTVLEGLVNFKNEKGETKVRKNTQSRAKQDTQPTLPITHDTSHMTAWTGDLVTKTDLSIPKRLIKKETIQTKPLNWTLISLLFIGAAVLGYILGYLYGKL